MLKKIFLLCFIIPPLLGSTTSNYELTVPFEKSRINASEDMSLEMRLHIAQYVNNSHEKCLLFRPEELLDSEFRYHFVFGKKLEKITEKIAIQRLGSKQYNHTPFDSETYDLHRCSPDLINKLNFLYNTFIAHRHNLILHCHNEEFNKVETNVSNFHDTVDKSFNKVGNAISDLKNNVQETRQIVKDTTNDAKNILSSTENTFKKLEDITAVTVKNLTRRNEKYKQTATDLKRRTDKLKTWKQRLDSINARFNNN